MQILLLSLGGRTRPLVIQCARRSTSWRITGSQSAARSFWEEFVVWARRVTKRPARPSARPESGKSSEKSEPKKSSESSEGNDAFREFKFEFKFGLPQGEGKGGDQSPKKIRWPWYLLAGLLISIGYEQWKINSNLISYNDFYQVLLPSGQIQKIVVRDDKAYIYLFPGATDSNGHQLNRIYVMGVASGEHLEHQVRSIETSLGMPPEHWVAIETGNRRPNFLALLIGIAIPAAFIYLLYRRVSIKSIDLTELMRSQMGGSRFSIIDPTTKEGQKKLRIKFKDVAGLHEAKVEISEFVDYLRNPSRYTKLGARLPKGALLTGPPGCGKTLLAKALAAESTVPFISMNGTEFVEMIGGLGASRVRGLFKEARERAPCIIFIDEIDAIGRQRGGGGGQDFRGGGGNDEVEQTLNQLLVEMDGIDSAKGVVILASTNRPDILDKALLRPGRFDRHISVDLPTVLERREMFDLYLKKVRHTRLPDGFTQRLAAMTPGFSGADIGNVVNEAAIAAGSVRAAAVTHNEIYAALDKVLAGPEKRSRVLQKEERKRVAYHEAGHALVGWMLEHTDALLKVTIVPRTSAALGFAQYNPNDKKLYTTEELFDKMCMMLGGRIAENAIFGNTSTGAEDDLKKVTRSAYAQVKIYGMCPSVGPLSFPPQSENDDFLPKPYSKLLGNVFDQEASQLIGKAHRATEQIVSDNIAKLELVAAELLKKETLSYADVRRLIGPPPFGDKTQIEIVDHILPQAPVQEASS